MFMVEIGPSKEIIIEPIPDDVPIAEPAPQRAPAPAAPAPKKEPVPA